MPCPDCGAPVHRGRECDREARALARHLEQQWALQALADARRDAELAADMLAAALD